jgi:hypothetical protein
MKCWLVGIIQHEALYIGQGSTSNGPKHTQLRTAIDAFIIGLFRIFLGFHFLSAM